MQILPDDINYYLIQNYINTYKDIFNLILINKYYFELGIVKFRNKLGFLTYINQNIPKYILNIFNHFSDFSELPILNISSYNEIINLTSDKLKYAIMRGNDLLGKKFISFKISFKRNSGEIKILLITLYQQFLSYYNSISHWKIIVANEDIKFDLSKKLNICNNDLFNEKKRFILKKLIQGQQLCSGDYLIKI